MYKKLIGDKAFYKLALGVAVPMMIQNGITNFVGLLDNIMIGRVGTEQMSGVAIVNQLMFVFNLAIFGAIAGPGIFGAQFYGCDDHKGVRHTFRFKLAICAVILLAGVMILFYYGENLILMYLHGEENVQALEAALGYGKQYLFVMLFGLFPFAVEQIYTSTLRECGETMLPMKAGILAVFLNLFLNYLLIFGNFGLPRMGVAGAAVATVISRYVQMLVVVVWTHMHGRRMPFIVGAYRGLTIPADLAGRMLIKGIPLMINEILWSVGMATLMQCYSTRGLDAVAGLNISTTISNLFNVVFIAMGNAIAIIVGQLLGAGKMKEARDTDTRLIAFSVFSCVVIGLIMVLLAPFFPMLYNTSPQVKQLASEFIRISALCMPMFAFIHAAYFTLRSGGKTMVTFLFDSVYMWCFSIPLAYVLSRFTGLSVVPLYIACQLFDLIKCVIGFVLVKRGVWMQNIVKARD